MKLLILTNSFSFSSAGMSGGDRMTFDLFAENDRYLKVWIGSKSALENVRNSKQNNSLIITPLLFERFPLVLNYVFRTLYSLVRVISIKDIEYIYSSSDFFPDVVVARFYRIIHKRVKWIQCSYHIQIEEKNFSSYIKMKLQRLMLIISKNCDAFICINSAVKLHLHNNLKFTKNIYLLTPGVKFSKEEILAVNSQKIADLPINIKENFFLSIGRISASKNSEQLIELWSKVIQLDKSLKLVVIGSGNSKEVLKFQSMIVSNKLDNNIYFLNYVDEIIKIFLLSRSYALINISKSEGYSIAIAEALKYNLQVLAWDLDVYREHFKGAIHAIPLFDLDCFVSEIIKIVNFPESKRTGNHAINIKSISDMRDDFDQIIKSLA